MSTRSIIVITGSERTNRIYKHSDGDPLSNLGHILSAIETAKVAHNTADSFTGHFVNTVKIEGARCEVEECYHESFSASMLGHQGDLEWIYIVNPEKKTVGVYSHAFDEGPANAYHRGPTDPMHYVRRLAEEHKIFASNQIAQAVNRIAAAGYSLNGSAATPAISNPAKTKLLSDLEKVKKKLSNYVADLNTEIAAIEKKMAAIESSELSPKAETPKAETPKPETPKAASCDLSEALNILGRPALKLVRK